VAARCVRSFFIAAVVLALLFSHMPHSRTAAGAARRTDRAIRLGFVQRRDADRRHVQVPAHLAQAVKSMACSLAVHDRHAAQVGVQSHYARNATRLAGAAGAITQCEMQKSLDIHRVANKAKHDLRLAGQPAARASSWADASEGLADCSSSPPAGGVLSAEVVRRGRPLLADAYTQTEPLDSPAAAAAGGRRGRLPPAAFWRSLRARGRQPLPVPVASAHCPAILEAAGIDMRRAALATTVPNQLFLSDGKDFHAPPSAPEVWPLLEPCGLLCSSPPAPGVWLQQAVPSQLVPKPFIADGCGEEFWQKFKYPISVTLYSTRRGKFRTMLPCKFFNVQCTRGDECWYSHCCSSADSAVLDELDRITSPFGWAPYEVFLYVFASADEHEHTGWIAAMRRRLGGSAYPSAESPGAVPSGLLAIGDAPAPVAASKKAAPTRPVVASAKFSHQPRRRLAPCTSTSSATSTTRLRGLDQQPATSRAPGPRTSSAATTPTGASRRSSAPAADSAAPCGS